MKKNNKGFTLIEIGLVLFVVGILVVILLPSFTQNIRTTSQAKATLIFANKLFQNITNISQSCNMPKSRVARDNGNSDLAPAGVDRTYRTISTKGRSAVQSMYQYCYDQSNVAPLSFSINRSYQQQKWRPEFDNVVNTSSLQIDTGSREYVDEIIKQLGLNPSDYPEEAHVDIDATKKPIGFSYSGGSGAYYIKFYDNQ